MTDESDGWQDLTGGAPLPEVAELESTDKLEELMHRVRGPLLRRLRVAQSAAELAAELDVPVTRLYHHLKVLESAGLIEVVATRRVGAALERRYRAVARSYHVGPDAVEDPRDLARSLASVLDSTRADLVAAVENGAVEGEAGDDVAIWSLRLQLAASDRVELVDRMNTLLAEFRDRSTDTSVAGVTRERGGTGASGDFAVFAVAFPTDDERPPRRSDPPEK